MSPPGGRRAQWSLPLVVPLALIDCLLRWGEKRREDPPGAAAAGIRRVRLSATLNH